MTNGGTNAKPAEVEDWDRPIGRPKPAPAEPQLRKNGRHGPFGEIIWSS